PVSVGARVISLGWAEPRDWIAAGTIGGEIVVLDPGAQAEPVIAREKLGDNPISALAWSPKELNVAFVCNQSSVCLWQGHGDDREHAFKPIIRFEGHANTAAVTGLSWSPSGRYLASTATDETIRTWALAEDTDASFALYANQPSELLTVATSPDGKWLAAGAGDGTVLRWDAATGAPAQDVAPTFESEVQFLAWSRNGTLAAIYENSNVSVVSPGQQPPSIALETVGRESRLAWADNGRILAVPMRDSRIALVDVTDAAGDRTRYVRASGSTQPAWGITLDPTGRTLFLAYADGALAAWDLAADKPAP